MDFMVFQYPMISVQACLDGILLGILFALIAYGMALQWGVMNIINIAQGDLVILGGYIAYFMYLYGIHPAWGVIVDSIDCGDMCGATTPKTCSRWEWITMWTC